MEKSFHAADIQERDSEFIRTFASVGFSFLLACTRLSGAPAPLAAVWLAGTSGIQSVLALCGGAAGYIISGGIGAAIPYIAAMAVIAAFRLLLGNLKNKATETVSAALAGICVLAAGAFAANDVSELITAIAFAAVTLVCAISAAQIRKLAARPSASAGAVGAAAAGILYTVLTAAFASLSAPPFNLGILLSAAAVLYVSEYRRGFSAAAGILSAVGIAAGSSEYSVCCLILAVSGLLTVLLERYGRLTRACAMAFAAGVGILFTGINPPAVSYAVSILTGSLLYAFIPERFLPLYPNLCSAEISASPAPYAAFGKKLAGMSAAIGEMNEAVQKTAEALDSRSSRDISCVYINAGEQICRSCKNNMYCWGSCYNRSADIMNKAIAKIRSGALADETALDGHFAEICTRRKELSQALNRQYAAFCSAESASRKVAEMRGLLSSQLDAARKLLDSMSEELSENNLFDAQAAEKICALMREAGLQDPSALAVSIGGRLTIDAYASGYAGDWNGFSERLSFALRKGFDPPMITEEGGQTHITLSERSPFDAQIKIYQKNKSDNRQNGDCCDCFNDGHGNIYMILSDGMGTGSRARIDSAFACGMLSKMLKAGIDFRASMEMLNGSLLVKSSDESFATLDVCRISLYTGEVSLYKAGGAETFVRCGKKFVRLNGSGIPFGVSVPAEYSEKRFSVSEGDVVIMTSDGAELEQTWLEQLVMRDRSADLDTVLDTIGEALRLGAEKGNEDDITVIGVKIIK